MMIRQLYIASALSLFVLALTYGYTASAQNVTTNVSNAAGNASAAANNTASELGQNASAAANNTASELGQNASEVGKDFFNKTAELGKKIIGGAADIISNTTD